jgi:hypothetical protein
VRYPTEAGRFDARSQSRQSWGRPPPGHRPARVRPGMTITVHPSVVLLRHDVASSSTNHHNWEANPLHRSDQS